MLQVLTKWRLQPALSAYSYDTHRLPYQPSLYMIMGIQQTGKHSVRDPGGQDLLPFDTEPGEPQGGLPMQHCPQQGGASLHRVQG